MKTKILSFIFVAVFVTDFVQAWGETGHRIVGEIAERNLNPKAKAAIGKIIGNKSLAEISTWGDEIRSDKSWDFVKSWHYLSIDDDESFDDFKRSLLGDVLRKLEDLEKFLLDPDAEPIESHGKTIGKKEALAFYIHFVGDIHQPLHVGRRGDQGGNKILVEWFCDEMSLHSLWDEHLIKSTSLSYTEFSTHLNRVSGEEKNVWQNTSYIDWAKESKAVRNQVYDFGKQRKPYHLNIKTAPVLKYDYRTKSLPIIRDRLAKAGIRLAGRLNKIFGE